MRGVHEEFTLAVQAGYLLSKNPAPQHHERLSRWHESEDAFALAVLLVDRIGLRLACLDIARVEFLKFFRSFVAIDLLPSPPWGNPGCRYLRRPTKVER